MTRAGLEADMTTPSIFKEPIAYEKLIGIKASGRMELSEKLQDGLPSKVFVSLIKTMEVSSQQTWCRSAAGPRFGEVKRGN
jgi:hypothetical protein